MSLKRIFNRYVLLKNAEQELLEALREKVRNTRGLQTEIHNRFGISRSLVSFYCTNSASIPDEIRDFIINYK